MKWVNVQDLDFVTLCTSSLYQKGSKESYLSSTEEEAGVVIDETKGLVEVEVEVGQEKREAGLHAHVQDIGLTGVKIMGELSLKCLIAAPYSIREFMKVLFCLVMINSLQNIKIPVRDNTVIILFMPRRVVSL